MNNLWFPYHLGFCPNKECWDKLMEGCKIPDTPYPHGGVDALGYLNSFEDLGKKPNYEPFSVVTIGGAIDRRSRDEATSVLIHESVHAFQALCDYIGEVSPSKEFQAYGIQSISGFMMDQYFSLRWKHGKKEK